MAISDQNEVIILQYLSEIEQILKSGDAREHAYRPAFQKLIGALMPEIQVINEPAYTGGNAPDFLFKKGKTPIAYAECKDVTVDINNKDVQKQAKRYVGAFGRILLTNYYDFQIIDEVGEVVKISIAEIIDNKIVSQTDNFDRFANLIRDYITPYSRTINSAKKLAEIMASKAKILRDNALVSLTQNKDSDIYAQYITFKEVLIRDLTEKDFADMYAQTLVYGLFVARYFDPTLKTFSRHEAQDLLPSTNPLLKKFFGHVAGTDYDPKIAWLVDSLIEAYLSTDVHELMHKEFINKQKDPVLHFYETFLTKYDQSLRKSRGVYYTPEPVVSFIVRSVDQLLKTKFNLPKGLSDNSKINHKYKIQGHDRRRKDGVKRDIKKIHKVQILDPAVGTGTFLNEVIYEIHKTFKGQEGMWTSYAKDHLLPRLHGFELMMASYTMAHLKLGVTLAELGYKGDERLSVWLTNSLEESVHDFPNLFMGQWLTEESEKAAEIKSEYPIMVVLGNPPYAVSSSNKGENIQNLIKVYKKDLNERKINLDDDYIKFIRFAENQIEKNGSGVVAMITNNSFIDGVTHRQMRKHLMETFDEIYILDLHGNSKKKEKTPDGGKDENVFSIMQGVSINLFVKTGEGKGLAKIYHSELFGKQKEKYEKLNESSFETMKWKRLKTPKPYYFFVPKDFEAQGEYEKGFGITDLFDEYNTGIQTKRDALCLQESKENLNKIKDDFLNLPQENIREKYNLVADNRDWKISFAKKDLIHNDPKIVEVIHRPFDLKWTFYTGKSKGFIGYPRDRTMKHMLNRENLALLCGRQNKSGSVDSFFIAKNISEMKCAERTIQSYHFPLYLYHNDGTRTPNLDKEIISKFALHLDMRPNVDKFGKEFYCTVEPMKTSSFKSKSKSIKEFTPEEILDYIYAVLHSPKYREKYKEFLKIDFPRVPYPRDLKTFWKLVDLGRELRGLHLLESEKISDFITTFPIDGSNIVEKKYPKFENGTVFLNETQYFGNVPESAWNFYIGGYQPAQKWLKDRRGRELSVEDIEHYQEMIVALSETGRVMGEVDEVFKV